MAATDRNVLRLGAYEILFTDTPDRVVINEAIELAKRYGTNNSSQFVNGVLDRLMSRETEQEKKKPSKDTKDATNPSAEDAQEPNQSEPESPSS